MKYEIKYISPASMIFSVVPVILTVIGFLGAITGFVIFPDTSMAGVGNAQKLVAVVAFTLIYALVIEIILLICVFVYNFFCSLGLSGVSMQFDIEQEKNQ